MNFRKIFLTTLVAAASCSTAFAQTDVRLSEDFESYNSTAEMDAVWVPVAGSAGTPGTYSLMIEEGQGHAGSDKWFRQNGYWQNTRTLASPIDFTTIDQLNFHFYTRAATWNGTRSGMGLRSANGSATYLQVGTNNGNVANKWAIRVLGIPGITSNYYYLTSGPDRPGTEAPHPWVKLEMQLTDSELTTEVDDVVADTRATTGFPVEPIAMARIGFGVPSNQPIDYDDLFVWVGEDTSVPDWDLY